MGCRMYEIQRRLNTRARTRKRCQPKEGNSVAGFAATPPKELHYARHLFVQLTTSSSHISTTLQPPFETGPYAAKPRPQAKVNGKSMLQSLLISYRRKDKRYRQKPKGSTDLFQLPFSCAVCGSAVGVTLGTHGGADDEKYGELAQHRNIGHRKNHELEARIVFQGKEDFPAKRWGKSGKIDMALSFSIGKSGARTSTISRHYFLFES